MRPTGALIFAATYLLISARRLRWLGLDRPSGAMLGGVACVGLGVLTPAAAVAAIDGSTLLLLFGVMGMGAFLALDGFFAELELYMVARARTPTRLLGWIVWGSGLLSAFITNDAVCVLGAPLVVRLIQRHRLPPLPFLLALATAANTGSVATLVGNPQNMLCAMLGHLVYRDHLLLVGPVALFGLAINHALLLGFFRGRLAGATLEAGSSAAPPSRKAWITLAVIAATAIGYTFGANLAWSAIAGFAVLLLIHRRDTRAVWAGIDWSLLVFFAGLFVVVGGLVASGAPDWFFSRYPLADLAGGRASWWPLSGVFLVGSNLVSNVPFILVVEPQMATLAQPTLGWELLTVAATFAGNLTLLGSVANIIVAESAREIGGIGFFEYLRFGVPLALTTTLMGTLWLLLVYPT